ncbi:MAG: hypothetical protein HYV33_04920 [Candidatus Kerfeldbacteria bacterium]|nr:hypothetical protein [Candidatus Kerfeldbacteria bacterium]
MPGSALTILMQGIQRTVVLLFAHPTKSFALVAVTDQVGTWQHSYVKHVALKRRARRLASFGSIAVVLTAVVISNYVLSLLPQEL